MTIMNTFAHKQTQPRNRDAADDYANGATGSRVTFHPLDHRPAAVTQRALRESMNQSSTVQTQLQLQEMLDHSPRVAAQMKLAEALSSRKSGAPQIKQAMQRREALEEEELAQRQPSLEEEEPLQGKLLPIQREVMPEEEEPLRGKLSPIQREVMPEEEEPMQTKAQVVQKQDGIEDEEPLQSKAKPVQKKENQTGLPDNLKAGVENLSGHSMDDVRVHYNSPQPAQMRALAYTQGTEIHVAPGQEKHLPHETWHAVQQKQGRVRPTVQAKEVAINDDVRLEREADRMGDLAVEAGHYVLQKETSGSDEMPPSARLNSNGAVQPRQAVVTQLQQDNDIIRTASDRLPGYFVKIVAKSKDLEDNKYRDRLAVLSADIKKLEGHIENRNNKINELTMGTPQHTKVASQLSEYKKQYDALVGEEKTLRAKGTLFTVALMDGSNKQMEVYREELGDTPVGKPTGKNKQTAETKFKEELNRHTPFTYIPKELEQSGAPAQKHIEDILNNFVAFRGDDRPPSTIFKEGFSPREQHVAPIYRFDEQDIHSASAVSASRDPAASAMFPLPKESDLQAPPYTDTAYLYAFIPDSYINTNEIQQAVASRAYPGGGATTTSGPTTAEMAKANLYGSEIAVKSVAGGTVVGAWTVSRTWTGKTYRDGCSYAIKGKVTRNSDSAITGALGQQALSAYYGNLSLEVRGAVDGKKSPKPG